MWRTGLVALRQVGSSRTRDQTRVPCIGRWILNHCATREVPIPPLIFNDSVKDSKNLKGLYLVLLGLQLSCLNLSHKSRDCLLLVRVPDLKAIKPTLADLSSENQQEVGTEKPGEAGKVGKQKPRPWSPHGKGSAAVTTTRRPPIAPEGLAGNALDPKSQGSSSTCGRVRGGRTWAKVARTGVSHLQLPSHQNRTQQKRGNSLKRTWVLLGRVNPCWAETPCTSTTGGRT